ncbi:8-oxo-dGTP pyrophosphatase MutT, NUDIX family [Rhizobium sp. RU20A]|uniref:CoA pyrophosphatase n=1 Tax=Rhizobium sp. RU20A TaxID=1907412 RepID=UPI0009545889|nr:CoA pyrophosphatase [Rhizobium sp. RU20A]SIQ26901.1 8-oxo-dGTP pyrophosphatase MutT, NUDIX family [Rhizobium sp. RU20A]
MSTMPFSATDFRRRAVAHGAAPVEEAWREHGDILLNPGVIPMLEGLTLKDAAVLVPVIDDADGAKVIFTQRTAKLRKHSGQIAFPGGGMDAEDRTPEVAALRETEEEIGLHRSFVETVGRLPYYMAMSGFRITPVLAVVRRGFSIVPNPDEVDAVFEVPLSFLMNPDNHIVGSSVWQGRERHYYRMPYGERNIWGITAGIVRTLYERLYA